jgi:hypothetical protein
VTRSWPWPADTPLDRARRVAQSYRAALEVVDGRAVARLDAWAVEHGQSWVAGGAIDYDPDELLTISEAADTAHVQVKTIYQWHQRGLVYTRTVDGVRVRAGDLVRYVQDRRRQRVAARGADGSPQNSMA